MKIEVNDINKTVFFWLTKTEQEDPELRESLKPTYIKYKEKKYTVAVFFSGSGDLFAGTRDLLLYNQKVSAKRDLELQKAFQNDTASLNMCL